ncbi:HAD family hydrolase [Anthocerotibacter panamensis]|uniref:HAD family hydrolase n=1 Tax=Anthocerotibacter panamensis TaxID=2857077 RepID=UPI001C4082AE|nr:HAD family hydrolase [Anthocerotibacter panamensis]
MNACLFCDFDGPLVDVSERYYQVYRSILPQAAAVGQPLVYLSKPEFWELKRAQVKEREIGRKSGLSAEQSEVFARLRRQTVHSGPFFNYDAAHPGIHRHLERLQAQGVTLAVVTMRRVRELEPALERFDLSRFFAPERRYCLANDYPKSSDVHDKGLLLEQSYQYHQQQRCYMVGDTEADILSAQRLGIPVLGILSGIRNKELLQKLAPWGIVNDLGEAADVILQDLAQHT